MHLQSLPLIIGGTVLKESDDLDTMGVKFIFMITLRSILLSF